MSATLFTPGPWAQIDLDDAVAIVPAGRSGEVLRVEKLNPNWNADAHLSGAAPLLYEALAYLVDLCSNDPATPEHAVAAEAGAAALAKARGEQPSEFAEIEKPREEDNA